MECVAELGPMPCAAGGEPRVGDDARWHRVSRGHRAADALPRAEHEPARYVVNITKNVVVVDATLPLVWTERGSPGEWGPGLEPTSHVLPPAHLVARSSNGSSRRRIIGAMAESERNCHVVRGFNLAPRRRSRLISGLLSTSQIGTWCRRGACSCSSASQPTCAQILSGHLNTEPPRDHITVLPAPTSTDP